MTDLIQDPKPGTQEAIDLEARHAALWMSLVAAVMSLAFVVLIGLLKGFDALWATGTVQPMLAFALSSSFIGSVWGWSGPASKESQKGEKSPIPALALGRLWLQCFVAIMLAILLTTFMSKLSVGGGLKPDRSRREALANVKKVSAENVSGSAGTSR